jgi:SAM-dependent methyltransferase
VTDCVRITACRLCDSTDLELIVSFAPTPPGDQYQQTPTPQTCYPLDLMACRGCGAVQLADTVDPKLIYTDYIYTTSISPGLDAHFDRYAASVLDRVQPAYGALVVDIGSNDGTLLKAFKARGLEVLGQDPAESIAMVAASRGIPTRIGFFSQNVALQIAATYKADIITANHIMANVADLHDFLDGVKALLAPDGTFVCETGYWPTIMQQRLIDTIEHEHIHYFALGPLVQVLARHGLNVVHAECQPTKGGSLRVYAKHAPSTFDASVVDMLASEGQLESTASWVLGLEALQYEVRMVVQSKPKAERWVGYGAAVGSTLLLHHCGLGGVIEELWDDNTSRHGLFSPGFHLPVVAPNHSTADKIVILAWRYADRIIAAHPEHAGKWIIPLPSLRFA